MLRHATWVAAVLALAVCAIAGCTSGVNRPVHEVTATVGSDSVQHVKVTAHSYYFDPNRIVVRRGVPVELTIKNGALFVPHDFTCIDKEAGVIVDQDVGMFYAAHKVRFTPTKSGEFPFHCDVDSHAKKGMMGTLVVKD